MFMRKLFVASAAIFLFIAQTASAAVSYSQQVILEPGWNIVSTPRILDSYTFSAPETLDNFSVFILDASRPSGWATMAELGQSEFTPLYGYFINNKATTTQTLTFNYKASTTPNERLFERKFAKEGWYSFGIANPSYAKSQGSTTVDTNNPDHILNSLLGATSNYDSVVDFTHASYASSADAVLLKDPWKLVARSADVTNTTEINSLNDFRETKGYAIYIKASSTLTGFQNSAAPQCIDGIDNDGDSKTDFPTDFGCATTLDEDEGNLPAGTFTLAKYSAYANQTVTVPQTAMKIGEYRLTTGATDSVTLTSLALGFASSSTAVENISNVYIIVDDIASTIYANAADILLWITSTDLSPNSVHKIAVYATLPPTMSGGESVVTNMAVGGISHNAGDSLISDDIQGQTIMIGTGSITASVDASTPIPSLLVGGTMPKLGSFKLTVLNNAFTIDELTAKVASVNDAAAITELVFKDGATELKRQPMDGAIATATGLSISVGMNGSKVIDIYANLGAIGTNAASAGANVGVTLSGFESMNSNGVKTRTNTSLAANNMYVYKTKPTITNVALPTTVLTAGTQTVYKFTITADAGGTVAWRKISLSVGTSTPSGSMTVTGWTLYDSANESTALANVSATSTISGSAGRVDFISTMDQEVSGSKTYTVKAMIGGSPVTGSTVSHSVQAGVTAYSAPAAYASVTTPSTFTWSDESIAGHSATTVDWNDDYLVKNIPTDSLTLTK
jgi:hypothetical protein